MVTIPLMTMHISRVTDFKCVTFDFSTYSLTLFLDIATISTNVTIVEQLCPLIHLL